MGTNNFDYELEEADVRRLQARIRELEAENKQLDDRLHRLKAIILMSGEAHIKYD